jgi:hypothetical protein
MNNEINIWDWMEEPTNAGMIITIIFFGFAFYVLILQFLKELQNRKGPFNDY